MRSGKNEKENMHEVKHQKKDDTLAFIQRFKEEALIPMKVSQNRLTLSLSMTKKMVKIVKNVSAQYFD